MNFHKSLHKTSTTNPLTNLQYSNLGIRSLYSTSCAARIFWPQIHSSPPLAVAASVHHSLAMATANRCLDLFVLCFWLFVSGKFLCLLVVTLGRERKRAKRDVRNWKERKKKKNDWRVFLKAFRCFIFPRVTHLLKNGRELEIFKPDVRICSAIFRI